MNDLAEYKRAKNKKSCDNDFPRGILDIIESDYPDRYKMILEDITRIEALFSHEEWVDILAKSRSSYESHVNHIKKTRKHLNYHNNEEVMKID